MKLYPELRKELFAADIDQKQIAEALGKSVYYVNRRMVGVYSWSIEEAYTLLRMIDKEPEEIFYYFPPGGGITRRKTPAVIRSNVG
ncbi:MAG: helix-turn-helix transcriptional regulator [Oscillospiraceae bacterium]|jgi:hypothetical protein|nr:helix-turn-helix transcriptional regulator [Oscillospiraceae bacterium]